MKYLYSGMAGKLMPLIIFFILINPMHDMNAQCIEKELASQSELDLWSHHNCWWEFVLWQFKAYRMYSDDWKGWGFNDACNVNKAYPKCVNSAYLLTYGLKDNSYQWHGTIDYRHLAEAWESPSHDQIHYVPTKSYNFRARANGETSGEDFTALGCALFEYSSVHSDPTIRASYYVHEGWHHWQFENNYKSHHMAGPIGACSFPGKQSCDWYYWHPLSQYAFGAMHQFTRDGKYFHSPYQAQVEFQCDIAENANSFVPASARQIARANANFQLAKRFRNNVGYRCGDPRPW